MNLFSEGKKREIKNDLEVREEERTMHSYRICVLRGAALPRTYAWKLGEEITKRARHVLQI